MHPTRAVFMAQKNCFDALESRIKDCLALWFVEEVIVKNLINIKQVDGGVFLITIAILYQVRFIKNKFLVVIIFKIKLFFSVYLFDNFAFIVSTQLGEQSPFCLLINLRPKDFLIKRSHNKHIIYWRIVFHWVTILRLELKSA